METTWLFYLAENVLLISQENICDEVHFQNCCKFITLLNRLGPQNFPLDFFEDLTTALSENKGHAVSKGLLEE